MLGQCFSIASSHAYSDAPYYTRGNSFILAFMVAGFLLTGVQVVILKRRNIVKVAAQGSPEAAAVRHLGIEEIQDAHPDFMYYL